MVLISPKIRWRCSVFAKLLKRRRSNSHLHNQATINLPYITVDAEKNPLFLDETITRAQFQAMTADLLERCKKPFASGAQGCWYSNSARFNHVVLVGGSTRMPAVVDLVRELTGGKEPNKGVNPDEVVAVGASLQAGV
jgi:molecular chaperone DnaK